MIGPANPQGLRDIRTQSTRDVVTRVEPSRPQATGPDVTVVSTRPGDSPVDLEKVSELRASIADGTYRPDPSAIAQRLLGQDI